MRVRVTALLLTLLAALLVAACGGGGGGGGGKSSGGGSVPAGADYVLSTAGAFSYTDTDQSSSQWKAASGLLDKFPGKTKLLALVESSLTKQMLDYARDVEPALGAELDVGGSRTAAGKTLAVGLTAPKDETKLEALIHKLSSGGQKAFFKRIGDWTAVSDSQASVNGAAAAHSGSSLAENATFVEAMKDLPGDALEKFWVSGDLVSNVAKTRTGSTGSVPGFGKLVSIAGAVEAHSDGLSVDAVVKSSQPIKLTANYSSKLVSEVPSGALAYLSFKGLDQAISEFANLPAVKKQLGQIEAQLGVSLADLAPLFAGEGALYVRQGIPLPEITIALEESDTAAAQVTADKLFAKLAPALKGQIVSATVDGVAVKQIKGQQFSLYYGTFDGKLVITDSTTGISGLKDSGDKLADDALFKAAKSSAGMPDSNAGFVYVNLKDAIPLVENLVASTGSANLSAEVQQNLAPLRSLLFFATVNGQKTKVSGFLGIE